jgi:valyl-tRNA synthetase
MKRVEGYRNFCNKLWNAANFVMMNTLPLTADTVSGEKSLSVVDHWIVSEFQKTAAAVERAMQTYRYDLAAKAIYEFVWDELCDWYLELTKPVLTNEAASPEAVRATRFTLISVLEATLRLAHPFLPFMTEEIWQQLPVDIRGGGDTIMLQRFPEADNNLINDDATADVAWLKAVVTACRNIRGEMDISFAKPIPILFKNGNDSDKARLDQYESLLYFLIKPESLIWLSAGDETPVSATHLVGDMQVLVPMSGLIDKGAEVARLNREIDRKEKERARAEGKINNPSFVDKAPSEVVQKEKDKVVDLGTALQQLIAQRERVDSL